MSEPVIEITAVETRFGAMRALRGVNVAFNNFEVSFYDLGAIPTLPTIAWGTLRTASSPSSLHSPQWSTASSSSF